MRATSSRTRSSKPRSSRRGGKLAMDLRSGVERHADALGLAGASEVVGDVDAELGRRVLDFLDVDAIDDRTRLPAPQALGDAIDDVATQMQRVRLVDQLVEAGAELGMEHELTRTHAEDHANPLAHAHVERARVIQPTGRVGDRKQGPTNGRCACHAFVLTSAWE